MSHRTVVLPAALAALLAVACDRASEPVEQPVALPGESPFEYPLQLWDQGIEGQTVLMVRINEIGDVDSTFVEQSSGHAEFDSAAVRGARQLRFSPARRGDRSVALWSRLPVRFARDGGADAGLPEPGSGGS